MIWSIGACITSMIGAIAYYNTLTHINEITIETGNDKKNEAINFLMKKNQKLCIKMVATVFVISFALIVLTFIYVIPSILLPLFFLIGTIYKLIISYRFVKIFSFANSIVDMEYSNLFKFSKVIKN